MSRKPRRPLRRKTENTRIKLTPQEKEVVYAMPLQKQFYIVHIDAESGCAVYQHVLVDKDAKDYGHVLAVARAYAKECDCWINPVVDKNAVAARARIFPGIADNANPDLTTGKYGYIDVKSPSRKSNIISNANDACKQGAIAIITDLLLEKSFSIYKAKSISFDIFCGRNIDMNGKPNYTKDQIHWFLGGILYKLNRPEKK